MSDSESLLEMFRTILTTVLLAEPALGVINETRSLVRLTSTFPHFDHEQAICGGVLISQNALLTAAHCVYDRNHIAVLLSFCDAISTGRYITWSNPISDKEIYDANCFATGWGITKNGTFATTPQRINLQLVQDELNGLIGYPVEDNIRACQPEDNKNV
ncbi:hypothetical protein NECAME_00459 [Necator americanus]|uniref:Peptidase S1 domain-containing protein n=1 Tax=Necator americanus TaxID=51031 RepID=W2T5P7_NECAM|nr:hypothetical protein NECAME_00459 [Necator americanus]ETN76934.1 hypothetical protein NECAME_00459 [Necator americanus]